jgi:hypothetical protein
MTPCSNPKWLIHSFSNWSGEVAFDTVRGFPVGPSDQCNEALSLRSRDPPNSAVTAVPTEIPALARAGGGGEGPTKSVPNGEGTSYNPTKYAIEISHDMSILGWVCTY